MFILCKNFLFSRSFVMAAMEKISCTAIVLEKNILQKQLPNPPFKKYLMVHP